MKLQREDVYGNNCRIHPPFVSDSKQFHSESHHHYFSFSTLRKIIITASIA